MASAFEREDLEVHGDSETGLALRRKNDGNQRRNGVWLRANRIVARLADQPRLDASGERD